MNYEVIDFLKITNFLKKSKSEITLNKNEAITMSFYNTLIIAQRENFDIRKNQTDETIYIEGI